MAKGSFGDVYKGKWKGYPVAVKMLRHIGQDLNISSQEDGFDGAQKQIDMLLQEIRIFEELKHPNIIGFYGASLRKGKLYFCTEFATHGSLYDFVHGNSETVYGAETVFRWSIEIAHGMDFLAEKNILHRDLKSPNILLTNVECSRPNTPQDSKLEEDTAPVIFSDAVNKSTAEFLQAINCKICDFGLSHKVGKAKGATAGTVRWMAPEALKKKQITLKSDVYSYGVVLWELVSRQRPWKDFNEAQVIWAVAELDKRPSVPEGFPDDFTAILSACWRTRPQQRPTWKELAHMLKTADKVSQ